jgi:[ribosomal protein S5]-alanine N-acetyltransferase
MSPARVNPSRALGRPKLANRPVSRIALRPLSSRDEADFIAAARASRSLHRPWTTAPATSAAFRAYLKRMSDVRNCALLVCRRDDEAMVGVVALSEIVRGRLRSAYLGYYAFAGHARQGLMSEGLAAVARFAFRSMKLHRLEANIQPGNRASIALVRACGFVKEGYSQRYLKIGGRWRDHERWAIVADSSAKRKNRS